MTQDNRHSRRSILRKSGIAIAGMTTGAAAMGTASASSFGKGQRVRTAYDGVPCWYDDTPCGSDYYNVPEGTEGVCQNSQQDFSCGTFVLVDDLEFNLEAWVNVDLLEHADMEST